jgi:flagellar protein FlaF
VYKNSFSAYQKVEQTTITGRETEARVLTEAAVKLKYCRDNWNAADRRAKLDAALTYTQRIWSLIQGDLLDESNPLPKNLKQNILTLSAFIDKRIFNIMAYPEPQKLTIIIDIHLNLAAGLRASVQTTQQDKLQATQRDNYQPTVQDKHCIA